LLHRNNPARGIELQLWLQRQPRREAVRLQPRDAPHRQQIPENQSVAFVFLGGRQGLLRNLLVMNHLSMNKKIKKMFDILPGI
jgi:hypothetical protein